MSGCSHLKIKLVACDDEVKRFRVYYPLDIFMGKNEMIKVTEKQIMYQHGLPLTNFARIRSFSGVNPHVNGQLTSLVEPCTTLVTAVRFVLLVLGMGPHMIPDVALERLSTNIAFVKTFIFVKRQNVPLQSVRSRIGFVAKVTLVLTGTSVKLHVRLQVAA